METADTGWDRRAWTVVALACACKVAPVSQAERLRDSSPDDLGRDGDVGLAPPLLTVNPTSADFGAIFLGDHGDWGMTVMNAGGRALAIPTLTVDGQGFSARSDCAAGLAPGDQCQISVMYTPTAEILQKGTLTIEASPAPAVTVELSGRGEQLPDGGLLLDAALVDASAVTDDGPRVVAADGPCRDDACRPPPDAYAGSTCPCSELTALAAACPMMKCIAGGWRPSYIGEGYYTDDELHAVSDGHLCARLVFSSGFSDSVAPNGASFWIGDGASTVVAVYTGLDFSPGARHTLICNDQRVFVGVTTAQCPALAAVGLCAAAGPIGPGF
jgi:hypothetical protein